MMFDSTIAVIYATYRLKNIYAKKVSNPTKTR